MLLQGHQAARVRRQAAELLVRYLGGDLAIVDKVCAIRGLQEHLAEARPADPRRVFGEAVEAAATSSSGTASYQLARVCTDIVAHALPALIDKLTAHIDERLAHLESRQRVNLNVRAPKRSSSHDPPIASDIAGAGRPLPLARFLDEKERADPTWREARRSFAPAFGIIAQVLKKRKLKDIGAQPTYVEQNHRPQIWYNEGDRALLQDAWELTAAHREDLVGRRPGAPPRVALRDGPSVMDMLRGGRE